MSSYHRAGRIAVHPHEHGERSRVGINLGHGVQDQGGRGAAAWVGADELAGGVDYGGLAARVRAIGAAGHVRLVETLAERIAVACLDHERVTKGTVTVDKLDFCPDAANA